MIRKSKPSPETRGESSEPVPPQPRKIALIGKAPDSVLLAPYDNPEWEIWILNTLGHLKEVPRWDRQFELHDIELTKDKQYGDYYQWLSKQTKPIFLRDDPPAGFAGGVRFPLAEIQQHFATYAGRAYLTNTVSLMLALVIFEHQRGLTVAECGLWGINMAQHGLAKGQSAAGWFTSEYARQRPSVEYWLGIAEAAGIKITIPDQSDILKSTCIYGYHTTDAAKKMMVRKAELQARIQQAQQREQSGHDEAIFLTGALEGMNYDMQWMAGLTDEISDKKK